MLPALAGLILFFPASSASEMVSDGSAWPGLRPIAARTSREKNQPTLPEGIDPKTTDRRPRRQYVVQWTACHCSDYTGPADMVQRTWSSGHGPADMVQRTWSSGHGPADTKVKSKTACPAGPACDAGRGRTKGEKSKACLQKRRAPPLAGPPRLQTARRGQSQNPRACNGTTPMGAPGQYDEKSKAVFRGS